MRPDAPRPIARLFSWAGGAFFVASLSYCALTYAIVMGRAAPIEAGVWRPGLVNASLFTVFALHHSVCARPLVRDWISRAVPPGMERSVYVWIASVMLIGVSAFWQPVAGVVWQVTGPAVWLCRAIQLGGVWMTIRGAAVIDVLELAGITPPTATKPEALVTSGPYGWVRHPIYTGWCLMVWGIPMMTGTRAVFAIVSCVYLVVAIPLEERSLRATLGEAYRQYATRVRWRLIPGVY